MCVSIVSLAKCCLWVVHVALDIARMYTALFLMYMAKLRVDPVSLSMAM